MIPGLIVHDSAAFASSLDVARVFRKVHHNVLKRIRILIEAVGENRVKFNAISYLDEYRREQEAFELGFAGFWVTAVVKRRGDLGAR